MMIRFALCFLALSSLAEAFLPSTQRATESSLSMGLFNDMFHTPNKSAKATLKKASPTKKKGRSPDHWIEKLISNPLQFHGSGETHLDEMYQSQQALLAERRKIYGKDSLKSKYHAVGEDHLRDISTIAHDPKMLNQKEDDAMYVDKPQHFPWSQQFKP
jgi:hypothetical protein